MKTCSRCGVAKAITDFHRFVHSKDGRAPACRVCTIAINQRYRDENREHIRQVRRAYYVRNRTRIRANNEAWKERNPERSTFLFRRSHLRTHYGLTPEDYDSMLAAQGGGCAICEEQSNGEHLHVDHDHGCCPGRKCCGECVRGLLCGRCNRLLGWYDRRRSIIERYLEGAKV